MFMLVEKTMNGTVEVGQTLTGYNAHDFSVAVKMLKMSLEDYKIRYPLLKIAIQKDDDNSFEYVMLQENVLPIFGRIENKKLSIING